MALFRDRLAKMTQAGAFVEASQAGIYFSSLDHPGSMYHFQIEKHLLFNIIFGHYPNLWSSKCPFNVENCFQGDHISDPISINKAWEYLSVRMLSNKPIAILYLNLRIQIVQRPPIPWIKKYQNDVNGFDNNVI